MADQKIKAVPKKLTCSSVCVLSSLSAASNKTGACQSQSANECTSIAKTGLLRLDHTLTIARAGAETPNRRQDSGSAHVQARAGAPRTSKVGASVVSRMCCVICAESNV